MREIKRPNNRLKQSIDLTDSSGNSIELIESKEARIKGSARILGAYYMQLRSAITEGDL